MEISIGFSNQQPRVDRYFDSVALQWQELYRGHNLRSEIFSYRQAVALKWIADEVPLKDAHVLDIGCGAGPASVAMAIRGARVKAVDSIDTMVGLTRKSADEAGLSDLIEASVGDVHALDFPENTFDAAVAIGLIYWLHSPQQALSELFRVLKPGGCLVVTADNARRLTYLLDPANLEFVIRLRRSIGSLLRSAGLKKPDPQIKVNRYSVCAFDQLVAACGYRKVKGMTIGFGPFSFLGQKWIPEMVGMPLHRRLQQLAENGNRVCADGGNHYIVLARKPR